MSTLPLTRAEVTLVASVSTLTVYFGLSDAAFSAMSPAMPKPVVPLRVMIRVGSAGLVSAFLQALREASSMSARRMDTSFFMIGRFPGADAPTVFPPFDRRGGDSIRCLPASPYPTIFIVFCNRKFIWTAILRQILMWIIRKCRYDSHMTGKKLTIPLV